VRRIDRALARARLATLACVAGAALGWPQAAAARPDLRRFQEAGPLRVYPDERVATRFYYRPGEIALAVSPEGKPAFDFLQIAYSGSAVSGDRGVIIHRNLLTLRVEMRGPSAQDLRAARDALGRGAQLDPMPIRRLDAALIYASAGSPDETALPGGHFEPGGEESGGTFWDERVFSLAPDDATAQLFWEALKKGQLVLSIGYAFYADAAAPDQPIDQYTGSPQLVKALKDEAAGGGGDAEGERKPAPAALLVRAGANSIHVDVARWPDLLHRQEFSGNVPPGYALLDVRCYDFADGIRPDLARRKLEIEAQGVADAPVKLTTHFDRAAADVTTRSLRFPFAVRLDRPYRYRVIDITEDGAKTTGDWHTAESWSRMLDITTPASARPAVATASDGDPDETK
jgi:hypothetical protein